MPDRDSFTPRPELEIGKYRHYKGGEYEVLTLAMNKATHEWLVVYRALYDTGETPDVWVRTYKDFTATVAIGGMTRQRFEKLS